MTPETTHTAAPDPSRDPSFIEYATEMLGASELTDGLDAIQLARVAAIGRVRSYGPHGLLVDELERSNELYIVQEGTVEVWLDPSTIGRTGQLQRIALLQAGQTCGELALLDGGVRSAQLKAGDNGVTLMAFNRQDLLRLCSTDTAIGFRIMLNLASALALRLRLQDMRLHTQV